MKLSRRGFLQATALAAGAATGTRLGGGAWVGDALAAGERSVLVAIHFDGGYNALFGSADSFRNELFGVNDGNVLGLGNGLVVDRATLGSTPAFTRQHMATIGVNHRTSDHEYAQYILWTAQDEKSYPLRLAAAMGGDGAIKAAHIGEKLVFLDDPPATDGVSLQRIYDMRATIDALGGGAPDPKVPSREIAASGLAAAEKMSKRTLAKNGSSLRTLREGFVAAVDTLRKPAKPFSFPEVAMAYGHPRESTAVGDDLRSKLVAAELMIHAGTNVVTIADGGGLGWDSHGSENGESDRRGMEEDVMPALNTFLGRMLERPDLNVVVALMGDFARNPNADHASSLSATVMGRYVKQGTTGRMNGNVDLVNATPGVAAYWAYLASVLKVPGTPFGANPHPLVL